MSKLGILCMFTGIVLCSEIGMIAYTVNASEPYYGDGGVAQYIVSDLTDGDDTNIKTDRNNISNTWVSGKSKPIEHNLTGRIEVDNKFRFFIKSVDLTTDRDWSNGDVYAQCLKIEYTYINDGYDSLYIGDNMIKVKDKTGESGVVQKIRQTTKPTNTKQGEYCTATIYVGLKHASVNATIYLEDSTIGLSPTKECSVFIQSDLTRG